MSCSKTIFLIVTLLLISNCYLWSQVELDHVWNNNLKVRYLKTTRWKATFGFAKRAELDNFSTILRRGEDDDKLDFNHIEFKHELTYDLNERFDIGLENRFRYRSLFDDEKDNEIRIAPYLILTDKKGVKENSYELKTEIRRRRESVAFRIRIGHELEQPFKTQLDKEDPLKWFFGTTLLSQFEADERTEVEIRNEIGIKGTLWRKLNFSLGVQLRNEYDFDEFGRALFYATALGYKF